MAITNVTTISAVVLNGVTIPGIKSWTPSTGIEEILESGDGSLFDTFVADGMVAPTLEFTTTEIKTALDAMTLKGADVSSNCDIYLQEYAQGGTRKSSTDHGRLRFTGGMVVPLQLTVQHKGGPATLTCRVVAESADGTTAPLTYTASQTYSITPNISQVFLTGPVKPNGSAINGVQGFTIDFGNDPQQESGDGEAYPTFTWNERHSPRITVQCLSTVLLSTFGVPGTAQGATDSVVFMRKVSEGGLRVADITAEHLSFTMDDGMIKVESITGSHRSRNMLNLVLVPVWDGTNDPLVFGSGVAIA